MASRHEGSVRDGTRRSTCGSTIRRSRSWRGAGTTWRLRSMNSQREEAGRARGAARLRRSRAAWLGVVPQHEGMWGAIAHGLRGVMDFVRYLHPRFAGAPALRARIKRKVLPAAYHWLDAIPPLSPARRAGRRARADGGGTRDSGVAGRSSTSCARRHPTSLLVSPLIDAASEQVDWVKAARACGIRIGRLRRELGQPDQQGADAHRAGSGLVWNEAQKRKRSSTTTSRRTRSSATGAQLFDGGSCGGRRAIAAAFCARVGLPDTRPVRAVHRVVELHLGIERRSGVRAPLDRRRCAASGDPAAARRSTSSCGRIRTTATRGIRIRSRTCPASSFFPRRGYNPIDRGQPRRLLRFASTTRRRSWASTPAR